MYKRQIYKYDNLQVNVVNMETAGVGRDAQEAALRNKPAIECQNTFRTIVWRAEDRGMKVNGSKTTMPCYSGARSMKLLGYRISSRPRANAYVQALFKK